MRCRHANFVTRYRHGESKARLMRASDLKVQKNGEKAKVGTVRWEREENNGAEKETQREGERVL